MSKKRFLYVTRQWEWMWMCRRWRYGLYRVWSVKPIWQKENRRWEYDQSGQGEVTSVQMIIYHSMLTALGIPAMRPGPKAIVKIPIGKAVKV